MPGYAPPEGQTVTVSATDLHELLLLAAVSPDRRAEHEAALRRIAAILSSFQSIRHPFILTPGDNDWTDCWPL